MQVARHSLAALGALAAAPLGLALLAARPSQRSGLGERLGGFSGEAGGLWVHGASVGELLAAARLVDRLAASGHRVVTSAATLSGRAVLRGQRPGLHCQLAPIDHPWVVERLLARARPSALVLVETELWPSWIAAASRRGVPVVLVSGRLSEQSYARLRLLRGWASRTLRRLAAIGARTQADLERFAALGAPPARLRCTGDLKLELDPRPPPLAPELLRALGSQPLLVAGSTHAGEEAAALRVLSELERQGLGAALVLAPRRPRRAGAVEALARAAGRRVLRRSQLAGEVLGPGGVLVLDSLGELPAVYGRARVCFVGGSLVPRGGHNALEPASRGRPVLLGPYTSQATEAVELLLACGAAQRVADAEALAREAARLLADPAEARRRGEAGRRALQRRAGGARRSAALIESVLAGFPVPA